MSNIIDIKCKDEEPPRDAEDIIFLDLRGDEGIANLYEVLREYTDLYDDDGLDNVAKTPRKEGTLSLVDEEPEVFKPKDIMTKLDEYIIGQDDVKKVVSVAAYNHYKRIHNKTGANLKKSNIMLIGPTGTGKTLFAQTLAKTLDVPLAITDATTLTEAGYVGEDVESLLERLYANAHGDLKLAEQGIIFVDEIDKVRIRENMNGKKDVSGEGVQQALLKLIEGSEATFKNPAGNKVTMDTSNILFIVGGAFAGIEQTIATRKEPDANGIGFAATVTNPEKKTKPKLKEVTIEDLKKYGMIPELLGRIPTIAKLDPLDAKQLRRILTEPKDSIIKHYEELFKLDGSTIEFTKKTLNKVARQAIKNGTGARGLQTILEKELMDLMFEAASDQTYVI